MASERTAKLKKRTSKQVDQVSDVGFAKFLNLFHSVGKEGLISLSVGEPDFATPWHICEAGIEALKQGITSYTPTAGFPELRQAIAQHLEKRYGIRYDPETEIVITVGSSQAMDLAFRTILDPGDEVIMSDPYYVCYPSCIYLAHGVPVPVPTTPESGFKLGAEQIEAAITPRTKVLLLGYPANPTGTQMCQEELAEIARVVEKHDLLVISDEIYSRLTYGMEHTCFASLPGMKERTILLDGFSKAYAMTGWRLGYAAGPAELIAAITKVHQHTMLSPPSMAQMAALEALQHGEEDVKRMVAEYDQRRKVIVSGLNQIGLACHEPKGAFYAFPSIQVTGLSSEEFTEKLLLEEKVVVMPGNLFGRQGEGFVRCCYATSLPDIEEALKRMARFVERYRNRA
ncbi:MAG TPA: aminotransferase class I/II-fold pyridoxal phosphate-dependent enzyme [Dehalococcoidia bacterium]|jgi:aminotransferase|nr:aminotransferase class I/II-fold pyridoxal phosphate-dependent enzyme [Dehalococcoidia bacterium]